MSREFLIRRLHSIAGLFFLVFLCEHLWTNVQAILPFENRGQWFIESVNFIHSLPALQTLEITFIALPAMVHAYFGIVRLFSSKSSSFINNGKDPFLAYSKNRCYTLMRITSWMLLIAIILHVTYMRYLHAPILTKEDTYKVMMRSEKILEVPDIGSAYLLVLHDTFSSMLLKCLYSTFVVIAAFHSCNGLWTFLISWGVTTTNKTQRVARYISGALLFLLLGFGIACIWGVNL